MREQLLGFVQDLRGAQKTLGLDEAATKQALILRPLSMLGWDCFNIEEVTPEYGVESNRVDVALRITNKTKVFIEVKRTGEDLEGHQRQLLNYSFQEGVRLAILTHGLTWWFYLPLYEGSWEDRNFFSIDVLQQDPGEIVTHFENFLSRENIRAGR